MTAVPLVSREAQRSAYGDRMLEATDEIVRAVRAGQDPRPAVDRALALPQPPGEDPVHWLAISLAVQVNPRRSVEQRTAWTERPAERARWVAQEPAEEAS